MAANCVAGDVDLKALCPLRVFFITLSQAVLSQSPCDFNCPDREVSSGGSFWGRVGFFIGFGFFIP